MEQRTRRILLLSFALLGALGSTMCGPGGGDSGSSGSCPEGICGSNGSTGSGSSTGPCTESWLCSPWDTGGNGDAATRTCTDTNSCGTTASKPSESAMLPSLDQNYFRCNVEPILDRKCAMIGCHGTETGRALRVYARARLRHNGEMLSDPMLCAGAATTDSCTGSNSCPCTAKHTNTEWQRNFDAARGFLLDAQGKPIPAGMEDTSDLIAQAMVGGKAHAGVHLFKNGDADYMELHAWLAGAKLPACDPGFN